MERKVPQTVTLLALLLHGHSAVLNRVSENFRQSFGVVSYESLYSTGRNDRLHAKMRLAINPNF